MNVTYDAGTGTLLAMPEGAIDSTNAEALQTPLMAAIAEHKAAVEIDFSKVPYISSAGLRVLVIAAKELKPLGLRLRLTGVSGTVLQVLNLANFAAFLDIVAAGN